MAITYATPCCSSQRRKVLGLPEDLVGGEGERHACSRGDLAAFTADAGGLRESIMPGVPDDVIAAAVTSWAGLFGLLSFELFGQFENVITDRDAFFGHAVRRLGRMAGLMG